MIRSNCRCAGCGQLAMMGSEYCQMHSMEAGYNLQKPTIPVVVFRGGESYEFGSAADPLHGFMNERL